MFQRQIRYNIAATLDGYIASENHTTPWITEDPTIDFPALYAQFALFVMGCRTWDTMNSMGAENPFQDEELKKKVLVLSSNEKFTEDSDVRVASGDVCQILKIEVERLETEGREGDVWIMGGAKIAGALIEGGLLSVVEVAVMPVVLGEGVKMLEGLGSGDAGVGLELEWCEVKQSGILLTRYEVSRAAE